MEILGLDVPDLDPDDGQPVDVLMVIKCLKHENEAEAHGFPYRLVIRSTKISTWEAHGMAAWVERCAFDDTLYGDP